jgi:hypothetical protein
MDNLLFESTQLGRPTEVLRESLEPALLFEVSGQRGDGHSMGEDPCGVNAL